MAQDMTKIVNAAKKVGSYLPVDSKKVEKQVQQITQDVLKKGSKLEKTLSDAATTQGKALIGVQKNQTAQQIALCAKASIKEENIDGALVEAKKIVRKAPIKKATKEEAISALNAEIEARYFEKGFAKKSAQESADVITKLSPYDHVAHKDKLMQKYGDKLEEKQILECILIEYNRQINALRNMIAEARFRFGVNADELLTGEKVKLPKRIQDARLIDETSFDEYFAGMVKAIKAQFTTKGLVELKTSLLEQRIPKRFEHSKTRLLEEINSELEFRQYTDLLGTRKASDAMDTFIDEGIIDKHVLEDKLAKKKEALYSKFQEEFEGRPARKSAKAIEAQSPVDLGARKIKLQDKFGDQKVIRYLMDKYHIGYDDAKSYIENETKSIASFHEISLEEAQKVLALKARNPEATTTKLISELANQQ